MTSISTAHLPLTQPEHMTRQEPQIEDDSKYVHPYPLNANLRLPADRRTLALWLACCTGKDVLRAMFHKPTVSFIKFFDTTVPNFTDDGPLMRHRQRQLQVPMRPALPVVVWAGARIRPGSLRLHLLCHPVSHHPVYPALRHILAVRCGPGAILPRRRHRCLRVRSSSLRLHGSGRTEARTAEALADIFDNAPSTASIRSGGRPCCVGEGADTDTAIPVGDQSRADCEAAVKESTWDGYDAPRSALI